MAKSKQEPMPHYVPSDEEHKWYTYCIENGIIISPMGIKDNFNEWRIGVAFKGNHKKVNLSPSIYNRDIVWEQFYLMCKYYYDKYRR